MKLQPKTNYYMLLFVIFGGFLIFGVSENIKGPALPDMQSELSLSAGTLGILLAINAFGFLLACTYTSWLISKIGAKTASILTFILMAISGVFIYFSTNFPTLVGAYFILYIGNGMLEIGLAIIAARLFTKNTGTMLNLSHFFYGLGSTVAPIIAAQMMGWEVSSTVLGWRGMYMIMLSLSILPIIPVMLSRFPKQDGIEEEDRTSIKKLTRDPIAWLIVFALTMGVTAELGIAAWLVNYLVKVSEWSIADASGLLSIFFFSFMLARLLLGPVTDKFGYAISIVIFSLFAGILSIIPIFSGDQFAILFGIAGFGIGPIYPTMMALLAKMYTKGTDSAITFTVVLIGIGGVITNLMIGYIIEWVTELSFGTTFEESNRIGMQAGYFFIALTAILCALATLEIYRRLKKAGNIL
ncbi:sucrose permease [Gracilibacillus boraciitolerans JCM 21714]|uniref:Sucrose permease n=1 Tax=Gracilibacillus boraciitolerans JCM 21714 TaxID=1298598 RepID=W4VKZ4_9BACI|nr:MFS transporter [Gracilibacillus boraciitolerans]GAE94055.1 sucrose permease [Gracilibacillus boraciitolerans JCM 21714]